MATTLLFQPAEQKQIFETVICTRKQIVSVLVSEGFMSRTSAYDFINGKKKCRNQYEYDAVMKIVTTKIERLQKAV